MLLLASNEFGLIAVSSVLTAAATGLVAMWIGPSWDSYTRGYVADLAPRMNALGYDEASRNVMLRWWGIALFMAVFVFGVLFAMPPVAVGITYLVYIAPRLLIDRIIGRRKIKLRDQMVRASAGLANSARAGLALAQGLEEVSRNTPQPLQRELKSIVNDFNRGTRLEVAIRKIEQKLDIEAFTVFTSAILTCMERGGKVTYALDRIAEGLQEMQRLERKLEADSAAGRQLAFVLSVFPLFFLGMFAVLDPVSTSFMFNTLIGQFVLLGVGTVVYGAMQWCMRILNIDF